jgi:hypothetical protein
LEGEFLAEWMPLEALGVEDPPLIWMSGKPDPEHVIDLSLKPFSRRPNAHNRRNLLVLAERDLDSETQSVVKRVELINQVKLSPFALWPMDGGDIGKKIK